MPELPTLSGGPSDTGADAAASAGIVLAANATANTKATAFTELIASTPYAANWLMVTLNTPSVGGTSGGFLVDIGVGPSTAEQVLVANLYAHTSGATFPNGRCYLFPLRIPAGTRISARCQAATGGATIQATAVVITGGIVAPPGLGRVETIGALTASSRGTSVNCGATAHTDVVGELVAATAFAYKWMCLAVANPTDVSWANSPTNFLVDVCVGGAGAEQAVVNDLFFSGTAGDDRPNPSAVYFPVAIAAGSRVSIRARCSVTQTGDRVLDYIAYGVG